MGPTCEPHVGLSSVLFRRDMHQRIAQNTPLILQFYKDFQSPAGLLSALTDTSFSSTDEFGDILEF